MYPQPHNYGLGGRWTDAFLGPLAEAGFPVLLDAIEATWPEVDAMLTRHPDLKLIVCRANYRQCRWAAPLLEAHTGLSIETSLWLPHGGIEAIVEQYGAGRLVFGTGMPHYAPGGAVSPVTYARIPDEAKRAIAGDTLRGIIRRGRGDE